ncbi:hypothetical protein NQ315_000648 [Exocentrus adspersus]|uniref:CCHC-type domain-containing protein n=1 Tax=Exocentrus adspersus TaxID=1586481 RepID=A0AAV8VNJ6_9CUCU|nr:hypothetical protein NQ315_000648 [Exocentrus adspersus]
MRSTNYDEMADLKELIAMLKRQREEDEKRRLEEKQEQEKRRQEDEKRRREEWDALEKRRLEEKQEEDKRKRKGGLKKRRRIKKERRSKRRSTKFKKKSALYGTKFEKKIDKKVQDLEQRIMKKATEECPGNENKIPIQDNKFYIPGHRHHKPPTFDGEVSWSTYKRQCEAAATTNGWGEQQKATELVLALQGKALQTLQNIPEEKQNDYSTVVGALELRFGSKYLSQVYQHQLKSRSQGPTETLQEFSTDIERMVRLAYPEAPAEFIKQLNVQSFIDGVKDPELQQALRLGRFKTLSEAVIYGLEFEAAKNVSRRNKVREVKVIEPANNDEEKESTHQLLKGMMALLEKLTNGDNKQASRSGRQLKCFGCGKIGHIQRNCRRR